MKLIDVGALLDEHSAEFTLEQLDIIENFTTVDAAPVAIKVEKYKAFGSTGDWYRCPRCGIDITGHSMLKPFYCRKCGQRLDWSDGKGDTQ